MADTLSAAGCTVLTPAQGSPVDITTRFCLRAYNLDHVRELRLCGNRARLPPGKSPAQTRTPPAGSDPSGCPDRGRRDAPGASDRGSRIGLRCRSAGHSTPSAWPMRTALRSC
ncbi:hypothetical protein ACFWJY_01905 [Streptomyces anulatus]|uniref:hypothetical protein n=1 Tax=Streptomyces anulatus TaxID=1892 RepID=UPI00364BBBD3